MRKIPLLFASIPVLQLSALSQYVEYDAAEGCLHPWNNSGQLVQLVRLNTQAFSLSYRSPQVAAGTYLALITDASGRLRNHFNSINPGA